MLIAFICWLVPFKTLAQETDTPKQKLLVVAVHHNNYTSADIVIKDNVLQPGHPLNAPKVSEPKRVPKPSPVGSYTGRNYSKEEVIQLIRDYSTRYGISADLPLRVARC